MRYAQINASNVCIAVSNLSGEIDAPHMIPIGPDDNPIGHTWSDGEWIEPPPAHDTPEIRPISRRQILTGLAVAEWITQQEALDAMATGARPEAVDTVINSLPEEQRFHVRMKWAGFTEAYRDDPLVLALATAEGKSEEEIDEFFRMCAEIK